MHLSVDLESEKLKLVTALFRLFQRDFDFASAKLRIKVIAKRNVSARLLVPPLGMYKRLRRIFKPT